MDDIIDKSSVGLIEPQIFSHGNGFKLSNGKELPGFELVYETYGALNQQRTNAILICHALSGNHHAAGFHSTKDQKAGWWDSCIGPGKPIDTNRFFVVSLNNLGGCDGSTGPISTKPGGTKAYGPDFPVVTVEDWVSSQALLADHLGIQSFAAVVGGSLGGMQALQWSISFPDRLKSAVLIASAAKLTAQNIAFNEIARQAITSDTHFHAGEYREANDNPDRGLMLARMIGHVTYLSDDGMRQKFGRELKSGQFGVDEEVQFQVESYLRHQGSSFSKRFDANTYILMTKALDYFDPARELNNDLSAALSNVQCKFCVISFSSDWRFSTERSDEIVDALVAAGKKVASAKIESEHGHDSFLLPIPRYFDVLGNYLSHIADEVHSAS